MRRSSLQVLREISLILRVNERVVVAIGTACHAQLAGAQLRRSLGQSSFVNIHQCAGIYGDMLKIYKARCSLSSGCFGSMSEGLQRFHLPQHRTTRSASHESGKCPELWRCLKAVC